MKEVSTAYLKRLISLIEDCKKETGQRFGNFLEDTFSGLERTAPDADLIWRIKAHFQWRKREVEEASDMWPEKRVEVNPKSHTYDGRVHPPKIHRIE